MRIDLETDSARLANGSSRVVDDGATQAARAAQVIERAIVTGILLPDARLGVHDLADRFGLGITPIREGLSRLTHRGFVVAVGNRGFRVAPISQEDLEDIIRVRASIEIDALRTSMEGGDDAWEAGVVAALHRMRRYAQLSNKEFQARVDEFELRHKEFHMALIAACGSPRSIEFCSLLYDQAHRYQRLMFRQLKRAGPAAQAEHEEITDLVLARDVEAACERYRIHLTHAMRNLFPQAAEPLTGEPVRKRRKMAAR